MNQKALTCPFCNTPDLKAIEESGKFVGKHPKAGKTFILFRIHCISCGGTGAAMTTILKALRRWNGLTKIFS